MKVPIVKIGHSQRVDIPQRLRDQTGISDDVEMCVRCTMPEDSDCPIWNWAIDNGQ